MTSLQTKTLWTGLALSVIIGLMILGNWIKPSNPSSTISIAVDPSCHLRKAPCTAKLPNGDTLSFSIIPRHIPLLETLQLQVHIDSEMNTTQIEKIEVDIIGLNMDMGYNRTTLNAIAKDDFKGHTTIPLCIRRKMEWQANVILYTAQGQLNIPFHFYTLKYNETSTARPEY